MFLRPKYAEMFSKWPEYQYLFALSFGNFKTKQARTMKMT